MTKYYQLIILTTSNKIYKNSRNSIKRGTFMTQTVNFAYIVNLLNPYLPDAKRNSVEETTRLLLNHATNNQIKDYSDASVNNFAVNGLTRSVARSVLRYIDKEKSPLSDYLSQIGDDQLTLIASKIKNDGVSKDVYRGVVPSYIEKWFVEDLKRTANRKNKKKQKKTTKSGPNDYLNKTVSDDSFSSVFTEVASAELPLIKNSNAIHAFILKPDFFPFSYKNMKDLILNNITSYAVARGIDKNAVQGIKAAGILRDYAHSGVPENLLGEMLTYIFLEHIDDARKLYTRAEISANSRSIDSEGIYLKNNQGVNQLILGASQLNDDLQDSIQNVVSELKEFRNNRSESLVMPIDLIDSSILREQYSDKESKAILKILVPTENIIDEVAAYGLFIGYKFSPDDNLENCSTDEAKTRCCRIVENDLHQVITQLNDEIRLNSWQRSSFYVYMLPFINASADGNTIMRELIG